MKTTHLILTAIALSSLPIPLHAASITIANPSFEDRTTADGTATVDGTGLNGFGWSVVVTDQVGVFNPSTQFPLGIPDGQNTAFTHGPMISQVLSAVLLSDKQYILSIGIGDANNTSFGGYAIQLLAGGVLLAQDNNTLLPPDGGFVTSTVSFTTLPTNPHLGQPLEIRLLHGGTGLETNFDHAQLTVTDVPEPSSVIMLALGSLSLVSCSWRRRTMAVHTHFPRLF
jgi:hapalindole H/12-epi-hapalindole U/12-epi-fischerindole U synthase